LISLKSRKGKIKRTEGMERGRKRNFNYDTLPYKSFLLRRKFNSINQNSHCLFERTVKDCKFI
jgi:hypothetical protein